VAKAKPVAPVKPRAATPYDVNDPKPYITSKTTTARLLIMTRRRPTKNFRMVSVAVCSATESFMFDLHG
jgi:hypothetical protein